MQKDLKFYERDFNPKTKLVERVEGCHLFLSVDYADLLFKGSHAHFQRAREITQCVIGLQERYPPAVRGLFPIISTAPARDKNANLFLIPHLISLLENHHGKMGEPLRSSLTEALRLALECAERRWDEEVFDLHRDYLAYSNIFVLYIQTLLLAARHYDDERLKRNARGQWQRWFNHIAYYGIDEFVSPTYNEVIYEALLQIHRSALDEAMRFQCKLTLDHLAMLQHAIHHPVFGVPVCGSSRDYRRYLSPRVESSLVFEDHESPDYRRPVEVAKEYTGRVFPRQVSGRAGMNPFLFRSWQEENAGLGSMTGGNYFPQQVHCMAVVGRNEKEWEIAQLPGAARARVWTLANGFVDQSKLEALCVFSYLPTSYHRTQVLARDADIAGLMRQASPAGGYSLGLTHGWKVVTSEAGLFEAIAYDHLLTVRPFVIENNQVIPTDLERLKDKLMDLYVFPKQALWLGCLVSLAPVKAAVVAPAVKCQRLGRKLTISASTGRRIDLFLQPSGQVTELYQADWRTLPLLECPAGTLGPGELAQSAANKFPQA